MNFATYIPCDILKPYVKHFIISETDGEKTYKVLSDTGLVVGFQYKGRLSYMKDETQIPLSTSGLTGLHDSFRIFKNSADTGSVLVFFKETGASAFFKQPIHELFSESVSLDNFMLRSELLILEEQLNEAREDLNKIKVIEGFLIARLNSAPADDLVVAALAIIHRSKGIIRIKDLAKQLYTSQSPLEKRFRQVVGASPKKFASIVRFKHSIQIYAHLKSLTDLSYEAGFYDQAHFIKEFKNFTGDTPEVFFSVE
jgi:AraC-like DNA-binding protein